MTHRVTAQAALITGHARDSPSNQVLNPKVMNTCNNCTCPIRPTPPALNAEFHATKPRYIEINPKLINADRLVSGRAQKNGGHHNTLIKSDNGNINITIQLITHQPGRAWVRRLDNTYPKDAQTPAHKTQRSPNAHWIPSVQTMKAMTMLPPKLDQPQNAQLRISPNKIRAHISVINGNMPSTTAPCVAGTDCMARAMQPGKPKTNNRPLRVK